MLIRQLATAPHQTLNHHNVSWQGDDDSLI